MEFDLAYLCKEVREIARASATFLKEERRKFDRNLVEEKSAHNYVSYVDKESERRIIEALSTLLPEAGLVTEEGFGSLTDEDSTSNYIHDIAPYYVSIALRNREELLLGVVHEVCRDECFYAVKDGKAYLDRNEIHVSDVSVLDKAFVALGFPYNSDAYRPVAAHLVDRLSGFAGGRFDARIESYLGSWDVAVGALILLQAGGKISDFDGGKNCFFSEEVVASNSKIHTLALSLLP